MTLGPGYTQACQNTHGPGGRPLEMAVKNGHASAARTDEYYEKVKGELEFAEEQLRTHNVQKAELEACLQSLQEESKSAGERVKTLDQQMVQFLQVTCGACSQVLR